MNAKQAKYPQLRFKGFTDPWEQRKLGDLGDILRKSIDPQLTPSREFVEYSMPSYDRGKRPNRVLGESMQSTRLKISGTVLLINKLNVRQRRIWFVKKAPENAVASGEFVPFQSFEIDLGFLHQLFLSDKTTSELQSISSGTSNSQKRVTPSDLLHYPICIPTTKGEQVVVGRFLSSIDNLITLHQRKLAKLKELKQGYLQKMFPQNGSKIPELRFKGFADAWEQRKSRELFVKLNEKNHPELPVVSSTQDNGIVYRNDLDIDIKYAKNDLINYKVIHPGNFVISLRSFQGGFEMSDILGITSPAYTIFDFKNHVNYSHDYWRYLFKSYNFIESLKKVTFGIRDGKSISFSEFSSLPVIYPFSKNEQRIIGKAFQKIDQLIAANQRKVEKLKELKKGYMQKMFC